MMTGELNTKTTRRKGQRKRPAGAEHRCEDAEGRAHRRMARWARVSAAAAKWTGKTGVHGWHAFGADAKWIRGQPWGQQAAAMPTRAQRRDAMTAACREGERVAAAHWAVRAAEHDGDTVVAKLRAEALKRSPATRGGAVGTNE